MFLTFRGPFSLLRFVDFHYYSGLENGMTDMKLKVEVNGRNEFQIAEHEGGALINGKESTYDLHRKSSNEFLLYQNQHVYQISVVESHDSTLTLNINGEEFSASTKDHIAQILEDLGMDVIANEVINEINAPMPGTIIDIVVSEGQEIQEGDTILILEAMKMENIIKSPVNATIQKIHIEKGQNVEKNQVLVSF
ncbi:acetyl-CoA carboxylase biotin carboxyl carrier protein subunit [Marinoscillum sp.]|uniref:acetyl-CoA carboxylase biotin carboxyl carrier protein subunit n=1 Tax=Marinoscillum sp. TaxID=2024838 RepID=UPI003BAA2914